ncbi:MAG: hypothetical protein ABJA98_23635 [Acidobacteriota bacterium]
MSRRSTNLRQVFSSVVITLAACGLRHGAAAQAPAPAIRVRSDNATLSRLIAQAREQSPTVRREIEAINGTDGLVYVHDARCGRGIQACLMHTVHLAAGRVNAGETT